jgi:DNA protecting protein DprA
MGAINMSNLLARPWTGLGTLAPRVDLWPVLRALRCAPEAADAHDWQVAGLDVSAAARVVRSTQWSVGGIRAGALPFPARLVGVPYGPVMLGTEGNIDLLDAPAVGIVGARACTAVGRQWARRLAAAVVDAGGVVVSGLAHGIDAEAHLAARGRTIAVLGCGLRCRQPAWQDALRRAIVGRGGLVVSEFAPDQPPATWTFPVRNRVLAALSDVVVVVEAGSRSGARVTARWAVEYGRDVLAVPGPVDAPASVGCLALIEEGAGAVEAESTVLEVAGLSTRGRPEYSLLPGSCGGLRRG